VFACPSIGCDVLEIFGRHDRGMLINDALPMIEIPTYTSHVVPLPTRIAPVVFERWWSQTRHRSAGAPHEVVEVELGRLALEPATWRRSHGSRTDPQRTVCGMVSIRGHRAWPVELELTPWSSTASELGLRFAGRRRYPKGQALARYHQVAEAVLESIGTRLLDLYPAELTEQDLRRANAA
jgi:hypothetical protein